MPTNRRIRHFTVTNRSTLSSHRRVPLVRMSGDWLGRAGFRPGSVLAVTVEHGRLVVTVEARPKPLPRHRASFK